MFARPSLALLLPQQTIAQNRTPLLQMLSIQGSRPPLLGIFTESVNHILFFYFWAVRYLDNPQWRAVLSANLISDIFQGF